MTKALVASSKIKKIVRKMNTKVMMDEITRIVLPKHSQIIERQQF